MNAQCGRVVALAVSLARCPMPVPGNGRQFAVFAPFTSSKYGNEIQFNYTLINVIKSWSDF